MAEAQQDQTDRRRFFSLTSAAMGTGLVASYGTLGVMAGKFLYPDGGGAVDWQFVAPIAEIRLGESLEYLAPSGMSIVIARQGAGATADDFIALSSVCPHLGCQVHWEAQNNRFFCPCHNGAFDARGQATEGPPAKAGQQLIQFPLKVEEGLLFIEVPLETVTGQPTTVARTSTQEDRRVTT